MQIEGESKGRTVSFLPPRGAQAVAYIHTFATFEAVSISDVIQNL